MMKYINIVDSTIIEACSTSTNYSDIPESIKSVIENMACTYLGNGVLKFYINGQLIITNSTDWLYVDKTNRLCFLDNETFENTYEVYFYKLTNKEYLVLYKNALATIKELSANPYNLSEGRPETPSQDQINMAYKALDLFASNKLPEPAMALHSDGEYMAYWYNNALDYLSIDLCVDGNFIYGAAINNPKDVWSGKFNFYDNVPEEIVKLLSQ